MNKSKKLEIYYPSGELDGIRCIKRHFSPLTTYVIPRMLRKDAKQLEGITRCGIYFLINDNDDNKITQIYVGQTTDGINRLDDHERHKIFWNKAIMFLADNDTFTLNILSGVEAHAIRQARESKNYSVENTVQPRFKVDEFDVQTILDIYDEIKFIMGTQGYGMDNGKSTVSDDNLLHTTRNGVNAFGAYSGEKFHVFEGSQISVDKRANLEKYNDMRSELISKGDIELRDGVYILKVNLEFKSPSGASDFVLGGSTNGWVEWKNKHGKTLDEIFRK